MRAAADSVTVKGETCRTVFYSSTYNKSVKSQRFTINGGSGAASGGIYINDSNTRDPLLGRASASSAAAERPSALDGSASCAVRFRNIYGTAKAKRLRLPRTAPLPSPAPAAATIVGMSQYGAKAMAELGYTYDEILKFYYTDITINVKEAT